MAPQQWVAIDSSTDRRAWARKLAAAHDEALSGGAPNVREVIGDSWLRCRTSGLDPEHGLAPVEISADQAEARWRDAPLSAGEEVLRELLADVGSEGQQVVLACDSDGTMLWIDGEASLLDDATSIHLQRGSRWDEDSAGTNAMGTALAAGHPLQVFSAEHFAVPVHDWTCSAAPVSDPESGEVVGVLDLSGELATAHPHSLALISAATRMVESELGRRAAEAAAGLRERFGARVGSGYGHPVALSSPAGTILAAGIGELEGKRLTIPARGGGVGADLGLDLYAEPLETEAGFLLWRSHPPAASDTGALAAKLLGTDRALVTVAGEAVELSRRHSEILVLLSLRPEGMSAERLALELYGDFGKPVTVRAELSRLRRVLGEAIEANPYRLAAPLLADFAEVEGLAASGRIAEALRRYRGPLLPGSEVPLVVELRQQLDEELRGAALDSAEPDLLDAWLQNPSGRDDVEACRRLAHLLPAGDPRQASTLARLRRLCGH